MRRSERIAGIIVAAGYSRRMGTFKPLLTLGNQTVLETAVNSMRQGGIQDVRVVTGHLSERLQPVLERLNVRVIENTCYAEGMFSSIVAGLKSLSGETEAFLLLPGDNPLIRRRSMKDIVRTYCVTGAAVVYPIFSGKRGHPPLISNRCFEHILDSDGTNGLRHILTQFADDSASVEVVDQGILLDMDTVEDYQNLTRYYARWDIPTDAECMAMLKKYQTDDRVLQHGQAVAAVGQRLALALNQAGAKIDTDLVVAACLVHDVAKGKHNHSQRGARLMACMGFPALYGAVASHMDVEFAADTTIDETTIVFLADKLVRNQRVVSLAERFQPALERFSGSPEIVHAILRRRRAAETIQAKLFAVLGISSFDAMNLTIGSDVDGTCLLK